MYQFSPTLMNAGFVGARPEARRMCKHNYGVLGTENEREQEEGELAQA